MFICGHCWECGLLKIYLVVTHIGIISIIEIIIIEPVWICPWPPVFGVVPNERGVLIVPGIIGEIGRVEGFGGRFRNGCVFFHLPGPKIVEVVNYC